MKKLLSLILILCLLLSAAACSGTAQPSEEPSLSSTEPSEPSEAPSNEPSSEEVSPEPEKTEPTAGPIDIALEYGYDPDTMEIPMLFSLETSKNECACYRVNWSLRTHTFSEPEFFYDYDPAEYNHWYMEPFVWAGRSSVYNYLPVRTLSDGLNYIQLETEDFLFIRYGKCFFSSTENVLCVPQGDGSLAKLSLPQIPSSVFDISDKHGELGTEPVYATVVGENVVAAYLYYTSNGEADGDYPEVYGELIYCVFPVDDSDAAQWNTAFLPTEACPWLLATSYKGALVNDKLYLPSYNQLLVVDLHSGELSTLEAVELMRQHCPEGTEYDAEGWRYGVYPAGSYDGILVVSVCLFDEDGAPHMIYGAVRDGELLGTIHMFDYVMTSYNPDFKVLGHNDIMVDVYEPFFVFAKDN